MNSLRRIVSTVACAVLLLSCGGGGEQPRNEVTASAASPPTVQALATPTVVAPTVIGVEKVSESRVSRLVYDYVYRVTVHNGDAPLQDITVNLSAVGLGTTILNGQVRIAELLAGATVTSAETITVRHDRSSPFDPAVWAWRIDAATSIDPVAGGAQYMGGLPQEALLGQTNSGQASVAPNDARNSITAYAIENATPGGARPAVDAAGNVTWVPNTTDFASTQSLRLTVSLKIGPSVEFSVPVRVVDERLVHQESLPSTTDTIADPAGRYLVKVEPASATSSMEGMLSIHEIFEASGRFDYAIRFPKAAGAKVTVLLAPNLFAAASSPGAGSGATASGRAKPLAGTDLKRALGDLSPAWTVDIGARIAALSGNIGQFGHFVFTTRSDPFTYFLTSNDGRRELRSIKVGKKVYQIDGNCWDTPTCAAIKDGAGTRRTPIILVHGFNASLEIGGGVETWGNLAEALQARGHPVFELRWITYMRFEEASGVLARLAQRVAEITGFKVSVIGHSFGGIVAHHAVLGKGIRYVGSGNWATVPVTDVFRRVITLSSPLSGISDEGAEDLDLTSGRAVDRRLTGNAKERSIEDQYEPWIGWCGAITCFQAGKTYWPQSTVDMFDSVVSAMDATRTGIYSEALQKVVRGETIRTLHNAWSHGQRLAMATVVVGLKNRPLADVEPDLDDSTAYALNDGLISLMGQAALPADFSVQPFGARNQLHLLSALGGDFLAQLNTRFAEDMYKKLAGGEYYFALRAAHSGHQNSNDHYYEIAKYPSNSQGRVSVCEDPPSCNSWWFDYHPLHFFITSKDYLDEPAIAYSAAPVTPPTVLVHGRLLRGTSPVAATVSLQLERTASHEALGDVVHVPSSLTTGVFSADLGKTLAEMLAGAAADLSQYSVVMRVGDGLASGSGLAIRTVRRALAADVDLGDIDVSLAAARVDFTGRVVDASSAVGISGATVYLLQGVNQPSDLVRSVQNTPKFQRMLTGVNGEFSGTNLEPGTYTLVSTREGYATTYLGNVLINANAVLPVVLSRTTSVECPFSDNFNRAPGEVRNGWLPVTDGVGAPLVIDGQQRLASNDIGVNGGVYRPATFSSDLTVTADLTHNSGFQGTPLRYETGIVFGSTGAIYRGYEVTFNRGDANYDDSKVELSYDGRTLARIASTFQYWVRISVKINYSAANRRFSGTVSDVFNNVFNFDFGPQSAPIVGNNLGIHLPGPDGRSSSFIFPTVDNFVLTCR